MPIVDEPAGRAFRIGVLHLVVRRATMARLECISENRRKTALLDSLMPTALHAPRVGLGGRGTPRSTGGSASDPVAVAASHGCRRAKVGLVRAEGLLPPHRTQFPVGDQVVTAGFIGERWCICLKPVASSYEGKNRARNQASVLALHLAMLRTSVILAALVLLASCASATASGSATPQDRQSILEVIRGGTVADQTAFIPMPPVCPGPVPATVRKQLVTQAPMRLGVYFTSPQLEKEIAIVTDVVTNPKGGPACVYGGGVDWVRLDSVSSSGNSAEAIGQVRAWSRIAQWQVSGPKMAEPHNTLDVTFKLLLINGRWLISSYDWKFAPGSEP
jgi:hypothetical protein